MLIALCWLLGMAFHIASRMYDWSKRNKDSGNLDYLSFLLRGDFLLAKFASFVLLGLWQEGSGMGIVPDVLRPNWSNALLLGYISDSLTKSVFLKLFNGKLADFRIGPAPKSTTNNTQDSGQ
jgi:hypothetical protein